jgi:polysaccharide export outer membrane protein
MVLTRIRHFLPTPGTLLLAAGFAGLFHGCVTTHRTTYLQETEIVADSTRPAPVTPEYYRVKVNDNIFIRVSTPDPRWSSMFNTLPVQTGITATEQTVDLVSYRVEQDSTIKIPFVGSIKVAGMTIPEITGLMEKEFASYITDADITVKLVNNYISVLGEVRTPGRYPIYKEFLNVFEALAMAGDALSYGDRRHMLIVRNTGNGTRIIEFNTTDRSIIDTEFYYVIPNDVIYVKPMKGKFFNMETFPFALILSSVTTMILILSFVQPTP